MTRDKLTAKQARFVEEYFNSNMCATQAYKAAGYSASTDAIAAVEGHKLLRKPNISEAIRSLQEERSNRLQLDVDSVVSNLANIAGASIKDYLEMQGDELKLKDLNSLTLQQLTAIESVKQGRYGIELKLYNKLTASDMLMKHLGGYLSASDLIDKLPPERLDQLVDEILQKLKR